MPGVPTDPWFTVVYVSVPQSSSLQNSLLHDSHKFLNWSVVCFSALVSPSHLSCNESLLRQNFSKDKLQLSSSFVDGNWRHFGKGKLHSSWCSQRTDHVCVAEKHTMLATVDVGQHSALFEWSSGTNRFCSRKVTGKQRCWRCIGIIACMSIQPHPRIWTLHAMPLEQPGSNGLTPNMQVRPQTKFCRPPWLIHYRYRALVLEVVNILGNGWLGR